MRRKIGAIAAVLGSLLFIYVLLMMVAIVPSTGMVFLGEPFIRFIAQLSVLFFMIAAWGFWSI